MTENYREPLKCKICDRMLRGEDDHYCIPCVEHLEAVIDVLKSENAALKTLKVLLKEIAIIIGDTRDKIGRHCPICFGGLNQWGHAGNCRTLQAIIKHPEVQAILKEGE